MNLEDKIYKDCLKSYQEVYESSYDDLYESLLSKSKKGVLPDSKLNEVETQSQKAAIKEAFIRCRQLYPNDIPLIWHSIYKAHIFRKSGISRMSTINNVVSADQSWKKSSGHAFEEMIKELATFAMAGTTIEFILQRDLNILLNADELANEPRDISWLREQVKGNIFDLYVTVKHKHKTYCIGCVQAKTSIRDRVTRDREPSIHAMLSYFWSIVFVLDGEYLKNPKFQYMVNGGTSEFETNGWHGMYNFSNGYDNDRIYTLDADLQILREHTLKAVDAWLNQRQWLDPAWRADED